jgi:hypothetical protein
LAKKGNYYLAECIVREITQLVKRQNCWKQIAKTISEQYSNFDSFILYKNFHDEESIIYYLNGWTEIFSPINLKDTEVLKLAFTILQDSNNIEKLLLKYAINKLFFSDTSDEEIQRLNRTLNIQWAIDIKNSIRKN